MRVGHGKFKPAKKEEARDAGRRVKCEQRWLKIRPKESCNRERIEGQDSIKRQFRQRKEDRGKNQHYISRNKNDKSSVY